MAGAWRVSGRQVMGSHGLCRAAGLVPTDGPAATEVGEVHTPAHETPLVRTPLVRAWSCIFIFARLVALSAAVRWAEHRAGISQHVRHRHAARARRVQMERLRLNGAIMEPPLRPLPLDKRLHNASA